MFQLIVTTLFFGVILYLVVSVTVVLTRDLEQVPNIIAFVWLNAVK